MSIPKEVTDQMMRTTLTNLIALAEHNSMRDTLTALLKAKDAMIREQREDERG